ncbi:MAG: radical SAM protein [Archangium sp.]|nr:radical SAM protein [Archangium sp.]
MPAPFSLPDDVKIPKAEIHVTEACNNRCAFCTTGWENTLRHVPREVIRAHLREAWEGGARRVLYQGGEPTLRPDLGELVADARAAGFPVVSVFTNARLASFSPGCERLVAAGVTWFQVSIQGGDAASHDASVRAPGAFAQTIKGTRALLARGQRVKVNAVLTRELLESLPAFARLICALRPEEVAFDTVKPSAAFAPGRADYATLAPALGPYAAALAAAVHQIHAEGLVVRLTSMAPCLVPGAAAWVSEEAPTTLTRRLDGEQVAKHDWKRSLQVKGPACATCACDSTCGGVYRPYAEAHGLGELVPLRVRAELPGSAVITKPTGLTAHLRAWFVRPPPAPIAVRTLEPLTGGEHRLECVGPRGTVFLRIRLRDGQPSYAVTERFAVSWERPADGQAPDRRVVDAVVRGLRQLEPHLPVEDLTGPAEVLAAQTIIDVPSVCERACVFCELSARPVSLRRPRGDDARVTRLIDQAPGAVLFTGDDALSNPRLGEFISRAAQRGAAVSVIGPPRGEVTAAQLPGLVAAGLRSWTTVLLGTAQRTHDARSGLEGAWAALHEAAPAAKAAGLTLHLVTPLVVPVLEELAGLATLARTLSPHPLTLLTYAPDSAVGTQFDPLVPPFEVLRSALARFAAEPASAGVRVDAAPLCVLPPAWRVTAAVRAERTDAALTHQWPEASCGSCAVRARCPGVLHTVLRAVGANGLTALAGG